MRRRGERWGMVMDMVATTETMGEDMGTVTAIIMNIILTPTTSPPKPNPPSAPTASKSPKCAR